MHMSNTFCSRIPLDIQKSIHCITRRSRYEISHDYETLLTHVVLRLSYETEQLERTKIRPAADAQEWASEG